MIAIPKTSVALLNAIAASPDSSRWTEFYDRYQPVIASYLQSKFAAANPPLEIDDIIQNTMIAFMKRIPTYRYDPDTHGHFRNFIVGIAKKKALGVLRHRQREAKNRSDFITKTEPLNDAQEDVSEDERLASIAKIAVHQVLVDESISIRDREIFRRTTGGESPESVADAFGITRNNVDQIKARLMRKVRETADNLNKEV